MKRQTPLLEVSLRCGLVSENQDLTCVRVCLYPLSVLLNYLGSEQKTGLPRASVKNRPRAVKIAVLCKALECIA